MTHLDTDVLAEFRAGLITGRRGARITAHLVGCDRCTALGDQLAGVSVLLASVPAPVMPDRVARRLESVLAAEVTRRDNAERVRGDGAGESPAPRRPGGNRGFRLLTLRVLAPAAAVVVLAAGGYGLSRIGPGSSSSSSAATAGGAAKSVSSAKATAGSRAEPAAGTIQEPAARSQGIMPGNISVTISHQDFSSANLAQQVKAALRVPASAATTRAASAQVRACVQQLAGSHQVVRVESARFQGRPATLIVARTGPDDTAWLADPGCPATSRNVLASTTLPSGISGP